MSCWVSKTTFVAGIFLKVQSWSSVLFRNCQGFQGGWDVQGHTQISISLMKMTLMKGSVVGKCCEGLGDKKSQFQQLDQLPQDQSCQGDGHHL